MSWFNLGNRTTNDLNSESDINQLMENIRILSGNGILAPTSDIKVLLDYLQILTKKEIDNLLIKSNATNPNYQIDVSFTGLRVELKYLTSVSTTIDITTMLDTGTEAVSTWYCIWIFAKDDGTYCFRFSTSATSPTVPSGYTYKRLIGKVYNNTSGNFNIATIISYQYGSEIAGNPPIFSCRAWCAFDGTAGDINSTLVGGNVSSITDGGVGIYTINFIIPMPDANYSISESSAKNASSWGTICRVVSKTANGFTVYFSQAGNYGSHLDQNYVSFAIFR